MYWSGGAKLILFGEFSALLGYPSLVLRLPLALDLTENPSKYTPIQSSGGEAPWQRLSTELSPAFFKHLHAVTLQTFSEAFEREEKSFSDAASQQSVSTLETKDLAFSSQLTSIIKAAENLFCRSSIPRAAGFGSSAALSLALARFVVEALAKELQKYNKQGTEFLYPLNTQKAQMLVPTLARRYENYFHGRSSGIDTAISAEDPETVLLLHSARADGFHTPQAQKDSPSPYDVPQAQKNPPRAGISLPIVYSSMYRREITKKRIERMMTQKQAAIHKLGKLLALHLENPFNYESFCGLVAEVHTMQVRDYIVDTREAAFIRKICSELQCVGKMSGAGGACFFVAKDATQQAAIAARCKALIDDYAVANPGFVGTCCITL